MRMGFKAVANSYGFEVVPPRTHLLFVGVDDMPSEGRWIAVS